MKKSLPLLTGLSMLSGLLPLAQPVYAADREPFADVASATMGALDSFVVKKDGTLWATGDNTHGQLGLGTHFDQIRLTLVPSLNDVQSVATESDTTLVVKKDGTVYGMGNSYVGMFADGTRPFDDQVSPVQVKDPSDPSGFLTGVKQVALGGASFALKQDGTVWEWGSHVTGGVAPSTLTLSQRPVKVPGLDHVVAISPNNLALKDDGTVWQWATSDNNTTASTIAHPAAATQVDGLSDVKQVIGFTTGGGGVAVKNDSTVWQWGDHDNSYDPPKAPHLAYGFEDVHDVAAFSDQYGHTFIKQDGTVWKATERSWSYDKGWSTPQLNQISGLQDVTAVSNNGYGDWAIEQDGSLWAWGQNDRYTLGTLQDTSKGPVQVEAGSTTQYIDMEKWGGYRRITFDMPDHNVTGSPISVTGRYDLQGYPLAGSQLTITVTAKDSGTQLAQQQLTTDADGRFQFDLQGSENWALGSYVVTVSRPDVAQNLTHEFTIEKESDKFTDIANHWARNDILSLSDQGIVAGYPDGTFHPDDPITRAQIAKMFADARDIVLRNDSTSILSKYNDKLPGWASQEIAEMTQEGDMHGYSDGAFHPNDNVTREQMATIFAEGQAYVQFVKADLSRFQDDEDISQWAQSYVAYNLLSNGMQGMLEDGSWYFRPQKYLTRAEACSLISRMLHLTPETAKLPKGSTVYPKSKLDAMWTQSVGEEGGSQPTLAGNAIITTESGYYSSVRAVDKDSGNVLWEHKPIDTTPYSVADNSPIAGGTNAVLLTDGQNERDLGFVDNVYALNPTTGEQLWAHNGLGAPIVTMQVIGDQALVLTTDKLRVYNAVSGTLLWSADVNGGVALNGNSTAILVGTKNGSLQSFTNDGKTGWTTPLATQGVTQIQSAPNGSWVVVQGDAISSLTSAGKKLWTHQFSVPLVDGQVTADNTSIYSVGRDGKLLALNLQTGNLTQANQLPFFASSAPVVQNGTLYLTTTEGQLAVISTTSLFVQEIVDDFHETLGGQPDKLNWYTKPLVLGTHVVGLKNDPSLSNDLTLVSLQTMTAAQSAPTTVTLHAEDPTSGELPYRQPWYIDDASDLGANVVRSGNLVITVDASSDGTIRATDLSSGNIVWTYHQNDYYRGKTAVSSSVLLLTTGNQNPYNPQVDMTGVQAFNVQNGRPLWHNAFTDTNEQVVDMQIVGDKAIVLTYAHLLVYNAQTGERLATVASGGSAFAVHNGQIAVTKTVQTNSAPEWEHITPTYATTVTFYNMQGQVLHTTKLTSGEKVTGLVADTGVYTATQGKTLTALNTDGRVLWTKNMTAGLVENSVVMGNHSIFAAQTDGFLRVIDAATGAEKRSIKLPNALAALPAYVNGQLYAATSQGHLEVIDASTLWVESETSKYGAVGHGLADLNWHTTPIVYESGVFGIDQTPNSTGCTFVTLR